MSRRLQPVKVATGSNDRDNRLVFSDVYLVAVLVRLSDAHAEASGRWFLEAGFGRVDDPHAPTFADLDQAQAWIAEQL